MDKNAEQLNQDSTFEIRNLIAETGRILVSKKLVARTWGNISARISENEFAITPSGLGYENLTADDIPVFNVLTDTWIGKRKPSSEKRIHGACYKAFPEVNFVVHTHQDYATAIGLAATAELIMNEEEKKLLGEISIANYGLPGTKKLKKGVEEALLQGSKVVLMIHHGAVICGTNQEEAIHKAEVLEQVCKRTVENKIGEKLSSNKLEKSSSPVLEAVKAKYPNAVLLSSDLMKTLSLSGTFKAQTDDMAQMLGGKLKVVSQDENKILKALKKQDAVLIESCGCIIKSDDDDDVFALELLITKAAISKLYTNECKKKIHLSSFDCKLMRIVYKNKYSKKKTTNTEKVNTSAQNKKKETIRLIKFILFSISAGVIEILTFALLNEILKLPYWCSYLIALILSVLWNFTFNRKFTFKAANNVPIAMLKVAAFYAVFTPLSTLLEHKLTGLGWNEYIVTLINMALNLSTEYVYDRFFVFKASIDTNIKK